MMPDTAADRSPGVVSLGRVLWQAAGHCFPPEPAASAGPVPSVPAACQASAAPCPRAAPRAKGAQAAAELAHHPCPHAASPCPISRAPFLSSLLFVLLSLCLLAAPSVSVSHQSGTHFPSVVSQFSRGCTHG